jgi:hypothetical protein
LKALALQRFQAWAIASGSALPLCPEYGGLCLRGRLAGDLVVGPVRTSAGQFHFKLGDALEKDPLKLGEIHRVSCDIPALLQPFESQAERSYRVGRGSQSHSTLCDAGRGVLEAARSENRTAPKFDSIPKGRVANSRYRRGRSKHAPLRERRRVVVTEVLLPIGLGIRQQYPELGEYPGRLEPDASGCRR